MGGKIQREGTGLSCFYYAPTTTLVAVPVGTTDQPFIFEEVSSDFQELTIQGQVTYQITEPKNISALLDFSLNKAGDGYASDDPEKLPQRVINIVKVLTRKELKSLRLHDAVRSSEAISETVSAGMQGNAELQSLGVKVVGLSILAIKPNLETAKALEAETKEELLRKSDEAIYARRNAAVEQERAIRENELNTEIAVEQKKRQIRETQMDAERAVQEKQFEIREAEMASKIKLEEQNKELVVLTAENAKSEADVKAYSVGELLKAVASVDPKVLQAIASSGMSPDQLISQAFQDLAGNATKIGELNISPRVAGQPDEEEVTFRETFERKKDCPGDAEDARRRSCRSFQHGKPGPFLYRTPGR